MKDKYGKEINVGDKVSAFRQKGIIRGIEMTPDGEEIAEVEIFTSYGGGIAHYYPEGLIKKDWDEPKYMIIEKMKYFEKIRKGG